MSSRKLEDLRQDVQEMAEKHKSLCYEKGIDLLIYCTLRSNEEQDLLYAKGRTSKGPIVTNARAGQSAHNPNIDGKALGYDCVPLKQGKPVWGTSTTEERLLWASVGSCGEEAGLVWSGRWKGKLKEMSHFQSPDFKYER